MSIIHRQGLAHRDVKAENIFMHKPGKNKHKFAILADFGFAKVLDNGGGNTILGTRITMAPELLEGGGTTFKVDIWALGCILYKMCFGIYPFEGDKDVKVLVDAAIITIPANFCVSQECIDLIVDCLQKYEKQRPNAEEMLKHPFLKKK